MLALSNFNKHVLASSQSTQYPGSPHRANLSPELLEAAARLESSDLVVVEADKGMGVCICSREYAQSALAVHLADARTYKVLQCDADVALVKWRARAHHAMVALFRVAPEPCQRALERTTLPVFRTLPKIHKMGSGITFDSRPITSACNSPTTLISDTLVKLLAPLTRNDSWTLHSSLDLLRVFERNKTPVPPDTTFLCFDAVALYTNMPVADTVRLVCTRFATFYKVPPSHPSVIAVHNLLTLLLVDNMFVVPSYGPDGSPVVFSQQHGIPMGLSVCVIIANIFVGSIFAPVFRRAHLSGLVRVFLARGYVDDGIALIQGTVEAIRILVELLGKAHPCIAITTVSSTTHAIFLDMVVSKGARWASSGHVLLDCKVHTKPGSLHLYIPYSSNHPRGALTAFISGEARRFVCLCTDIDDAREQCRVFAEALQARGYPLGVIVKELCKIDHSLRLVYLGLAPKPDLDEDAEDAPSTDARTVAFVIPHTPTSARWGIGEALRTCFESVPHLAPVLAWQNAPSLQHTLGLRCLKPPAPNPPSPPPT